MFLMQNISLQGIGITFVLLCIFEATILGIYVAESDYYIWIDNISKNGGRMWILQTHLISPNVEICYSSGQICCWALIVSTTKTQGKQSRAEAWSEQLPNSMFKTGRVFSTEHFSIWIVAALFWYRRFWVLWMASRLLIGKQHGILKKLLCLSAFLTRMRRMKGRIFIRVNKTRPQWRCPLVCTYIIELQDAEFSSKVPTNNQWHLDSAVVWSWNFHLIFGNSMAGSIPLLEFYWLAVKPEQFFVTYIRWTDENLFGPKNGIAWIFLNRRRTCTWPRPCVYRYQVSIFQKKKR